MPDDAHVRQNPRSDDPLGGRRLNLLWIMPFWPTPSNPTALTPARDVALLLARAGHSVTLLGMSDDDPEPTLRAHPNLYEDPLVVPGDGPGRQAKGAVEILRRARRLHRARPFDLAFVRFAHPIGVTAAIVAGALRIPLIYQEEAPDLALVTERRIERLSMSVMATRAALCCASGPKCAQDTALYMNRPVYPIPLAIDVNRFQPTVRTLDQGPVRMVTVGRLHEQKGTSTLIDAMVHLPERYCLDLVGDGTGRADAQAQVDRLGLRDRVAFLGYQPPAAVPKYLEQAHLFVLPSTVESFCVAAAEALAAGRPVVSTRCGGPEYFVGPDDGRIVPVGDSQALASAVRDVVDHYDGVDHLAIARRARNRFGPDATIRLYESMFAHVLGGPLPEPGPFGPFWFPTV